MKHTLMKTDKPISETGVTRYGRITWSSRKQSCDLKARRITPPIVDSLLPGEVFVFGTDVRGEHSYGAARFAFRELGAVKGRAEGPQGRCYAIPAEFPDPADIKPCADRFEAYAKSHPELTFLVIPIGCGAAGHTPEEIAPLFAGASGLGNVCLPKAFWDALNR